MGLGAFAPPILSLARVKRLLNEVTPQDALVSVKDFGATGDGVTDDTPAIQAAFDAVAPTGAGVWFPAGTYLHKSTVNMPSGLWVEGSAEAVLLGDINGAYPLTGSIWRSGITGAAAGASALSANVTPGSNQLQVASVAGATEGGYVTLNSSVGLTGNFQSYQILNIAGTTLTLDSPVIAKPFVIGDAVAYYNADQVPTDITIIGHGMHVRGKAVVSISLQTTWRAHVEGLVFDEASATSPSDACFGFNHACVDCTAYELVADMFGGGAPSVVMAPESSRGCVFFHCTVKNGANAGFEFVNSFDCTFIKCVAEANVSDGFAWTNDIVVTNGSDFCACIGCYAIGNGAHGFDVGDFSADATMKGCYSLYNVGDGYFVNAGSLRTSIDGKAIGNTGALAVVAGAKKTVVSHLEIDANKAVSINLQDDCTIGSLVGSAPGTVGVIPVLVTGGVCSIDEIDITHGPGATATYLVQVDAGRLSLGRGHLLAGVAGDVCMTANGTAVLLTGAVKCQPDGGVGGTVGAFAAAGTIRIQDGFDADGTATPMLVTAGYINRGTFTFAGAPAVVAFPDLKSTDTVKVSLAVLAGAGTGLSPAIVQTPTTGFTATAPGGDTSTWRYEIS